MPDTSGPERHQQRLTRSLLYRGKKLRKRLGVPADRQWCRTVMDREVDARLSGEHEDASAVEVSGIRHAERPWSRYESYSYPAFDICTSAVTEQFDVVICEQVLEHVPDPMAGARTLRELCRPGGLVVVSTPFLIRLHPHPYDFWRFSPEGLRILLTDAGLQVEEIGQWGNRAAVRANLYWWAPKRWWRSLRNEGETPLVVWAIARRPWPDQV